MKIEERFLNLAPHTVKILNLTDFDIFVKPLRFLPVLATCCTICHLEKKGGTYF